MMNRKASNWGGRDNLLALALFELLAMTALAGLLVAPLSAADIMYNDGQEHINEDKDILDNIIISGAGTSFVNEWEGTVYGRISLQDGTLHNYGTISELQQLSGTTNNGERYHYDSYKGLVEIASIYGGEFNNNQYGTVEIATVRDSGVFNNNNYVGVVSIQDNGVFNNNNYVEVATIQDNGVFNNAETVGDELLFDWNTRWDTAATKVLNDGVFNNNANGTVWSAIIEDNGVFNNNTGGTVERLFIQDNGIFNNAGTVRDKAIFEAAMVEVRNNGVFNNDGGTVDGIVIQDNGVLNNSAYGTIRAVDIYDGALFNNNGTVVFVTLSGGEFNNHGTVEGNVDARGGYAGGFGSVFNNQGTVEGNADAWGGYDGGFGSVFNNQGTVEGNVNAWEGYAGGFGSVFNNQGIVEGNVDAWGGYAGGFGSVVNNQGTVEGNARVGFCNTDSSYFNDYLGGEFNNTGIVKGNTDVTNDGVMNNEGVIVGHATINDGKLNNEATGRIEGGVTLLGGELVHNGWISGDVNVEGGQLSGGGQIDGTLHIASGGIVDTAVFTGMINKLILDEGGTLVFNLDLLNGDFSTLNFAPESEPAPFSIMSVFGSSLLSNSDLMELNGTVLINILNDEFVDAETKNEAQSLLEELLASLNIDPTTPEIFSNWSVQSINYLVSIGNDGMLNFERKDGGEPPVTPEPATLLLIGMGLAGLPIIRKRMMQAA